MLAGHVLTVAALAAAIGCGAFMLSVAQIFAPARKKLARATDGDAQPWTWLYDLVTCPFCVSTWMSLAATAIYRPLLVHEFWPLDYLVTVLATVSLAMLFVMITKRALGK